MTGEEEGGKRESTYIVNMHFNVMHQTFIHVHANVQLNIIFFFDVLNIILSLARR